MDMNGYMFDRFLADDVVFSMASRCQSPVSKTPASPQHKRNRKIQVRTGGSYLLSDSICRECFVTVKTLCCYGVFTLH